MQSTLLSNSHVTKSLSSFINQALLDLLEPYFSPLIDDLLDDVESGRTWTQGQVPEAVAKLTANIMDIAHLIPPSFYQVGDHSGLPYLN